MASRYNQSSYLPDISDFLVKNEYNLKFLINKLKKIKLID